ncbi:MAG: NADP-dependent oxidoreductase [Planctomycetota bacterium]
MKSFESREIQLASRPAELPAEDSFRMVSVPVREPGEGEILVRNVWMSVDPYMRGRMRTGRSYVTPFGIDQPLDGGCVGRVVASRNPRFVEGDWVVHQRGWREYWLSDESGASAIDVNLAPPQAYLGVLGMPGMTAYVGMLRIGAIAGGETVLVSGAAGAVGSIACQIARLKGCRVLGIAGSPAKVTWLEQELGVEVAIDHRAERRLAVALHRACPGGIDVYFDNVGGEMLEAALQNMKDHGRVVACGMIAQYNDRMPPAAPRNLMAIVVKRLTMKGFIVTDHADLTDQFRSDMAGWLRDGKIKWRETVVEGLENAPRAFVGLFKGENIGKMLVRIAPDDAGGA